MMKSSRVSNEDSAVCREQLDSSARSPELHAGADGGQGLCPFLTATLGGHIFSNTCFSGNPYYISRENLVGNQDIGHQNMTPGD
jgi:hypothetical protein